MILVRHFAKLLWGSELLEKLESKVEDLNEAEDGEASEETHRAPNQTNQLIEKNQQIMTNLKELTSRTLFYQMFAWCIGILPFLSRSISS